MERFCKFFEHGSKLPGIAYVSITMRVGAETTDSY